MTYQILDTPDGRFAAGVMIEPDKTFFRAGFATSADAEEWIDGLRTIMAAVGAPVSLAFPEHPGSVPVDALLAFMSRQSSSID